MMSGALRVYASIRAKFKEGSVSGRMMMITAAAGDLVVPVKKPPKLRDVSMVASVGDEVMNKADD